MLNRDLYRVYWSKGSGIHPGPGFRSYQDAVTYVNDHAGEASFAIKTPKGTFLTWNREARGSRYGWSRHST